MFAAMGKSVVHVGPTGSGALLKLINNFLCGVQVASPAQALSADRAERPRRQRTVNVLMKGRPAARWSRRMFGRMSASDYTPNFFLELALKDLRYAIPEGRAVRPGRDHGIRRGGVFEKRWLGGPRTQGFSAVMEPYRAS